MSILFMLVTVLWTVTQPIVCIATGMPEADKLNSKHGGGYYSILEDCGSGSTDPDQITTQQTSSSAPSGNIPANVQAAFSFLTSDSVAPKLTSFQAVVVIGTMQAESGKNLDPNATNPDSGAYGIAQWLGGRLSGNPGLREFAQQNKSPINDLTTQLKWLKYEYTHSESKAYNNLAAFKPQTKDGINDAVYNYEADFERSGHAAVAARRANALYLFTNITSLGGTVDDSSSGCSTPATPLSSTTPNTDRVFPVSPRSAVTSFSNTHPYLASDIMTKGTGMDVVALESGVVKHFPSDVCGKDNVEIYNQSRDEMVTYMHMQSRTVSVGQTVSPGQKLGTVGNCNGPHLHIDIHAGSALRPSCSRSGCRDSNFKDVQAILKGL